MADKLKESFIGCMRKDRKEAGMRVGVELFLRRRISKTAKVLENKGLRPFFLCAFVAYLSLKSTSR